MNLSIFLWPLYLVFLSSAVFFGWRLRGTKLVHIADYEVGLRFRDGSSFMILPPGSYRSSVQRKPITVVDQRPHMFLSERLMFQDLSQAKAVISVGGSLAISDPQLAMTSMKNVVPDSLVIIRECLLQVASHSIVDSSLEGRANLTAAVVDKINGELRTRGVEIGQMEISELWAWPPAQKISTEVN